MKHHAPDSARETTEMGWTGPFVSFPAAGMGTRGVAGANRAPEMPPFPGLRSGKTAIMGRTSVFGEDKTSFYPHNALRPHFGIPFGTPKGDFSRERNVIWVPQRVWRLSGISFREKTPRFSAF
jgi:hypothetical protein